MTVNQISPTLLAVMLEDESCHINEDGRIFFYTEDTPSSFIVERDRQFIGSGAIPSKNTEWQVFYEIPKFNVEMFIDRTRLLQKYFHCESIDFHHDEIFYGEMKITDVGVQHLINCGFPMKSNHIGRVCISVNDLMSVHECEFSPMRDECYRVSVSFIDHLGNIVTHLHRSAFGAMENIKSIISWAVSSEMNDLDEDRITNILRGVDESNYREVANKWGVTVQLNEHWS